MSHRPGIYRQPGVTVYSFLTLWNFSGNVNQESQFLRSLHCPDYLLVWISSTSSHARSIRSTHCEQLPFLIRQRRFSDDVRLLICRRLFVPWCDMHVNEWRYDIYLLYVNEWRYVPCFIRSFIRSLPLGIICTCSICVLYVFYMWSKSPICKYRYWKGEKPRPSRPRRPEKNSHAPLKAGGIYLTGAPDQKMGKNLRE